MESETVTLDIRPVPVREKHPTIFRTFDELAAGKTLLLINDHDPKPLYYQFTAERGDQFQWNYVEQGPEVWKVAITKKGKSACGHGCGGHAEHPFETATEALKGDHRVIEKVLDALERLTRAPELSALDQWEKAIDFIRNFADKCHHLKEEKILFPALEERGIARDGGPIGMMLMAFCSTWRLQKNHPAHGSDICG